MIVGDLSRPRWGGRLRTLARMNAANSLHKRSRAKRPRVNNEPGVYDDALAYDIIHQPGTREEVAALIRIARGFLPAGVGKHAVDRYVWLEPACGSGRCVRELVRRGGRCVGVDIEPGMIEFARASVPREARDRGDLVVGDMRRMDASRIRAALKALGAGTARPVVAFCPHNSIRHLSSDADMVRHLRSTANILRRFGGIYLVGIGLSGPGGEGACETVHFGKRAGVHVREVIDFLPPTPGSTGRAARREHAYKHVTLTQRGQSREMISSYVLRTYTQAQWHAVVRASGLNEIGVAGAWGEAFDAARLHYAYRVLAAAPSGAAGTSVRSKKSAIARSAGKRSSRISI